MIMGQLTAPYSISVPRASGLGRSRMCEIERVRVGPPLSLQVLVPCATFSAKGGRVFTLLLGIYLLMFV